MKITKEQKSFRIRNDALKQKFAYDKGFYLLLTYLLELRLNEDLQQEGAPEQEIVINLSFLPQYFYSIRFVSLKTNTGLTS